MAIEGEILIDDTTLNNAMQGLLGSGNPYNGIIPNQIASDSYKYATALLDKLKEEEK